MTIHGKKKTPGSWGFRTEAFKLIESLTVSFPDQPDAIVSEALRRGADGLTLLRLLHARQRVAAPLQFKSRSRFGSMDDATATLTYSMSPELSAQFEDRLIQEQTRIYEEDLRREFHSMPADLRAAFGEGSKRKRPKQADELKEFLEHEEAIHFHYYKSIRWRYYNAGYSKPVEQFLMQIKDTRILGHAVAGGLHKIYIDRLAKLESVLEGWQTGLASEVGKGIRSIGGFCPRTIQETSTLSNHSFGLAIDVDAPVNPHIRRPKTIGVLKEVTGYDFGALDSLLSGVLDSSGDSKMEALGQINENLQVVSERLRNWLRVALPCHLEHKSMKESNADDETKIQILLEDVSIKDLQNWSDRGIQTIPVAFAAAMGKLGFKWGVEYKKSKDVMHFELLADKVLQPDSPRRTVNDLFPIGAGAVLWEREL